MLKLAGKKSTINMTEGSLFDKILLFSIPLMLSSFLQLLYNAADIIVIGNYEGKTALAAVGATSALINLLINLFIGLSTGSCVCAANAIGAQDGNRLKRYVHTSMAIATIGGLAAMLLGVVLARPMLEWMKTPHNVIDLSVLYMRIYFLGMPANLIFNFAAGLLRASGDTKRPLYILSVSGIINVVLNLFFVVVCHLSVAGVAIATVISQVVATLCILKHIMTLDSNLKYTIKETRIYRNELWDIAKIGLPCGFQGMLFSISNVMIQSSINYFGDTVMAGNTAASNIEGFIYAGMNTLYQASQTFTSQNLGAGKLKRIKKVLADCLIIVTLIGVFMGLIAIVFRRPLLGLYASGDSAVIDAGIPRLYVIAGTYFLCGIMDCICGVIRGMKYSISTMIIALVGVCGFRILWLKTVFEANKTVFNVYITYPISWILTTAAFLVCFFVAYHTTCKKAKAMGASTDAL